jgi:phosphatidylserine decarboxylase
MKFSRHGLREMIVGTIILLAIASLLVWLSGVVWLALLPLPVLVWLFAFFRDPERQIPTDPNIMVSPSDGTVSDIKEIEFEPLLGGPAVRIGMFLSIFSVHGNRAPCDGKVTSVTYKEGKFLNALSHDACSEFNESNTIVMADQVTGVPTCIVKQIAGAIARRIISGPKVGEVVRRGDRIGFIKFGSRTELFIPKALAPQILVKVGDKPVGGRTIIARLGAPANAIA